MKVFFSSFISFDPHEIFLRFRCLWGQGAEYGVQMAMFGVVKEAEYGIQMAFILVAGWFLHGEVQLYEQFNFQLYLLLLNHICQHTSNI